MSGQYSELAVQMAHIHRSMLYGRLGGLGKAIKINGVELDKVKDDFEREPPLPISSRACVHGH